MTKDMVIVGTGGFAKEVKWLIDRINCITPQWNTLGFIDRKSGDGIIGDDGFLLNYNLELNVVIAIGNPDIRKNLVESLGKNDKLKFPNLIDPSVLLSGKVQFGIGNIICAGTVLTVDIQIGNFSIINLDCTIGHDALIGDYVTINPGVNVSGGVKIGSLANIGTGTQIIQEKEIGCGAVIGAGAVVTHSVPRLCAAVGVPAKPIKFFGGG